MIIPYMHKVYLEQIHSIHYISILPSPPHFYNQCLVGFSMLSSYEYMKHVKVYIPKIQLPIEFQKSKKRGEFIQATAKMALTVATLSHP
jgi:hypothetical protein